MEAELRTAWTTERPEDTMDLVNQATAGAEKAAEAEKASYNPRHPANEFGEAVSEKAKTAYEGTKGAFVSAEDEANAAEEAKSALERAGDAIANVTKAAYEGTRGAFASAAEDVEEMMTHAEDEAKTAGQEEKGVLGRAGDAITNVAKTAYEGTIGVFTGTADDAEAKMKQDEDEATDVGMEEKGSLERAGDAIAHAVKSAHEGMKDLESAEDETVSEEAKGAFEKAGDAVATAAKSAKDGVCRAGTAVSDTAHTAYDKMLGKAN